MPRTLSPVEKLMVYICGDGGSYDDFNPFSVMGHKYVSELLFLLNRCPQSFTQISSVLKADKSEISFALKGLLRIKALEEKRGNFQVAFPIFTKDDLLLIRKATVPIASDLAKGIWTYADEIDSLSARFSCVEQVGAKKVLFAAIGCFVLDWMGLRILEREGLLSARKPKPGNRNYLLFAREQVDSETAAKLYERMYWGSHSDSVGKLVFTSFGDHHGFRYSFPDISWRLQALPKTSNEAGTIPQWIVEKLSKLVHLQSRVLQTQVGSLLFSLNKREMTHSMKSDLNQDRKELLTMLEDMNYVLERRGVTRLNYPVFVDRDKKVVENIGSIVMPLAVNVVRQNYGKLQNALANISPIRNAVGFDEIMNESWHWIFAQTNKILAERGFLYDPPKRNTEEARYIAWVSEFTFP